MVLASVYILGLIGTGIFMSRIVAPPTSKVVGTILWPLVWFFSGINYLRRGYI